MNGRIERYAPLAGVVFFVLVAISFVLSSETPAVDDSTREVVSYWTENEGKEMASAVVGAWATVFFVWFAASWRSLISRAEGGSGRLASIVFGGALIFAAGLLSALSIEFAAAESAGDVPAPVTQTLSVLYSDFFFPLAGGFALFLLGSAVAIVRTRVLPVWLGWIALVIGIVALTPLGFFGFIGGMIWILVASVVLFLRGDEPEGRGTGPEAPASTMPA